MNNSKNFRAAAETVVPFGKYAGRTIDIAAESDDGLLYLDWLRGSMERDRRGNAVFFAALCAYLDDDAIAADVRRLVR